MDISKIQEYYYIEVIVVRQREMIEATQCYICQSIHYDQVNCKTMH